MQRLESLLRWILLGALIFIPFLTYQYNEQSPFELPKLVALSYATLLVAVGFIWTKIKKIDFDLRWNYFLTAILILLLAVTLSYQKSNYKFFSFWGNINVPTDGLWSVIICSLLAVLVVQLFYDRKKILSLAVAVLLSHIGLAAYGIVQHFGIDPIDWWGYADMRTAAYATLGQPVAFATMVGVSIPLMAAIFYCQKNFSKSFISGTALFVLILGQLYSGSRAPVLVSAVAILVVGIFGLKTIKNSKKKLILLILITASANFTYFVEGNTAIGEKLKHGAVATGLSTRMQVWEDSLKIWKKYPILGSGPETFANELKIVNEKEFNTNYHWGMFWHKAHNQFFHFLATIGLVGVLAHIIFSVILAFAFFKIIRFKFSEADDEEIFGLNPGLIAVALLMVPISIYVANLTAFNFVLTQAYTLVFAALVPSWLNDKQHNTVTIRFPRFVNPINIIFLTIMAALFSNNIYNFFIADRYFSLARKYYEVDRDFAATMKFIDKAIIYMPEDCRHVTRKAMFLSSAYIGQRRAGVEFSNQEAVNNLKLVTQAMIDCNKNASDIWYYRGSIFSDFFHQNIISSELIAEESFIESRKLNPANPVITFMLGALYHKAGRFKDFEREMLHAIDLKSDFFVAYGMLIEYYYTQSRQNEIDLLVNKIKSVQRSAPDMLRELAKLLELSKKNNDFGNAKVIKDTYMRLTKP